ncbi:GDSL-like Lipase/Acylhydrolase [Gimesia panareensis]|uniref:GDSL-like Lipase/Acylhydrolase n=1 Tax=Gimesia panareensis TaxID=2527978 RepID=A0A518FSK4_9PLAN|nr:SGNH/GDSL hydrolase family protein [Gimesia panareensis]QDV19331.1 GDSL-like Lipase/Acylhydrolase [Gimesia panareensis]
MKQRLIPCLLFCVCFLIQSAGAAPPPLKLKSGDRVIFLGNTMIERAQKFGRWEEVLLRSFPEAKLSFRNLGWSGDTVWADSRGIFDPPAVGYQRMIKQIKDLKPTVILLGYGGNEAFAGEKGLPAFENQLHKLLADLEPTEAKIVIVSPHRYENQGAPLPDPAAHNRDLKLYTDSLKQIADKSNYYFVDLYNQLIPEPAGPPGLKWTTNSIHLTEAGYQKAAEIIAADLELQPITLSPEVDQKVRDLTFHKNRQYFYNWRPQNITYLLGFRKHEQGQNAKELPQFIPLIEKNEAEIHRLVSHQ